MFQEILLWSQEPVRPKTTDSGTMHQAIEANLVISTQRVSGKPDISQFSMVHHRPNHSKSCQIVPHITKILQNF